MPEIRMFRKSMLPTVDREYDRIIEVAWNVFDTSQTVNKCGLKPLLLRARTT